MSLPQSKTCPSSMARRPHVYVDIPPSPLHSMSARSANSSSGSSLKENAPLLTRSNTSQSVTTLSSATTRSSKRRRSDASLSMQAREELQRPDKKVKLSPHDDDTTTRSSEKAPGMKRKEGASNKSKIKQSEYNVGSYFYCHQCNKKRDVSEGLHCTFKSSTTTDDSRCRAKYCRACLKNRYDEALESIKANSAATLSNHEKQQHVSAEEYYFQCPRCRDECNCRVCRKAKGLEPTGKFVLPGHKKDQESAASRPDKNTANKGKRSGQDENGLPAKKPRAAKKADKTAARTSVADAKGSRATKSKPKDALVTKSRAIPKSKLPAAPKPIPRPSWNRVNTHLSQSAAEQRIHVREFVLRFSSLLDIGKGHLDELEEISAMSLLDDDKTELVGWVSEACVKSIVLGLLSIIAEDCDSAGVAKVTQDTIKEIRASGANLNKIWSALSSLRDGLRSVSSSPFDFPDPLPLPSSVVIRSTRSGIQGKGVDNNIYVASSAQLVPIIADLVESAIDTTPVREEIDLGVAQDKELAKDVREAIVRENNRWKDLNASGVQLKGNVKSERERHKQILRDLDHAHMVARWSYIPRYATLGQDHEGRVYYIMSPGEAEREAALHLIAGKDGQVRLTRRRGGLTEEDRQDMRRWSWFVAVWGPIPDGALVSKTGDEEDLDGEDEETEGWWGFWNPEEIQKLAEWLTHKCELGEPKSKHNNHMENDPEPAGSRKGARVKGRSHTVNSYLSGSSLSGSRSPSPLSDLSDADLNLSEEDGDEEDEGLYAGMRTGSDGRPIPTKSELRRLVAGLTEYAGTLQWRIHRVGGNLSSDKVKETTTMAAIPSRKFYS